MLKGARDTWINPVLSLAVCFVGGYLFSILRTPLPWMIGPMCAMAACNFAGWDMRAVPGGRQVGQLVIGSALGLYFTPEVAREVAAYGHLLLIAAVYAIALGWISGRVLGRITGTDATTAFFASVPGGAVEMAVLGERFGARVDRIAIAQSLRVLVVVIAIPFALTYSGVHGAHASSPAQVPLDWLRLVQLLAIAAATGASLAMFKLPNAFLLGPLLVVTVFTILKVKFSAIPVEVTGAGQLLLGCSLGARLERKTLRSVPRYSAGVLAGIAIAIGLSAAFGALLALASGLPIPSLILATAPGGLAEMCITAQVLQLGVPLVTAAQVARVMILLTCTGSFFKLAKLLASRRREH